MALKNAPITTPESNRTRVSMPRPEVPDMASTRTMASTAPTNAATGSAKIDVAVRPRTMAPTAPTAAPLDTPRTYGSARGFLRRAWKTAPLTASPAPTNAAKAIRGTRRLITMVYTVVSALP